MKINKFKALIAHTMSTGLLLAPGAILYLFIQNKGAPADFFNVGPDLFIASLMLAQILALAAKLVFQKDLDTMPYLKYFNAHAWKGLLDITSIRSMQRKQNDIMVKIRTGVIDEEVVSTYAEYKFNSEKVDAWLGNIYYNQTPRNYRGDLEDSPQSRGINFRFKEIINSVEKIVSKDVLQALIKDSQVYSLLTIPM